MEAKFNTKVLLCIAAIVERADEQILPAVYMFVGRSFGVSLSELGSLTAARAVVQALSSPLSGLLGDRYSRTQVIAMGCYLWAAMTALIGLSRTLQQAMLCSALNGVGLALVIPCIASMVADVHRPDERGRAFGTLSLVSSTGGMATSVFATNIGGMVLWGMQGWRVAFLVIAVISVATGAAVQFGAVDPRVMPTLPALPSGGVKGYHHHHLPPSGAAAAAQYGPGGAAGKKGGIEEQGQGQQHKLSQQREGMLKEAWRSAVAMARDPDVRAVLRVPTFRVIVLAGIVGTMPWMSLSFNTLFFQLLGFSNAAASSLTALFTLSCAVGGLLGGAIGDLSSRWSPDYGRILTIQSCKVLGLPLALLLFKGLPWPVATAVGGADAESLWLVYAAVLLGFGLLISWVGINNSCIFADVVPQRARSKVYAFDRCLEGALGSAGLPLVGMVAESVFGFERSVAAASESDARIRNAGALSSAMMVCLLVPWLACLAIQTCLYFTYPADRKKAEGGAKGGDHDV